MNLICLLLHHGLRPFRDTPYSSLSLNIVTAPLIQAHPYRVVLLHHSTLLLAQTSDLALLSIKISNDSAHGRHIKVVVAGIINVGKRQGHASFTKSVEPV